MENPFDENMMVLPPAPVSNDGSTYKFPSAEGYETVPDNWKPTSDRPLPALRCTHTRDDDSRCKNFGVRGTGFNGTPSMCFIHGGSLPSVKAKAEATLLVARMRLVENTGMALDTLFELTKLGRPDNIRLKAATEILDRAGVKGAADFSVEVTHTVSASDSIADRLKSMADRLNPPAELEEIVDAEVVDNQQ